ncbi:hypothetical protein DFH11DRAFT_1723909 [Phellopilus nigrolimitatus]|nr:hypothetical protein DFH11DRAFT_1723909 [Phellopilus nigrolimitatus]
MNITIDYDGPRTHDTSLLVSLDEYKNRNSSGSSLSLSFGPAAHTELEDYNVTASLRVTRAKDEDNTAGVGRQCRTSTPCPAWSLSLTQARSMKKEQSAVFERLKLSEYSKPIERNTQWLRDQTSRAINGIMTPESVVSDGSSLTLSYDDLDAQSPFDGDLALQQDNGHYYYSGARRPPRPRPLITTTPASASTAATSLVRPITPPPPPRQIANPRPGRPSTHCGHPARAATCGERTPRPRASPGANGLANGYADGKGKARADIVDVSMFDPLAYLPCAHTNGKPFPTRPRPLPTLPSAPSVSSASSSSTVAGDSGNGLCPGCFETAGVLHALAGDAAPDEPASASPEDQRTLSQLRRAVPKQKGHFRRAYLEKRTLSSLDRAEQDNISECTICNTSLTAQRYKCASCKNFVLRRACYSQVHEIHPSHAFLDVPDRPHRSRSEPDLELTNNLNDDGLGDESLTHPDVKCAHCLMDIVGARFHCAICESVDICSNCEAASLPGNLDADDGGHNTSHIMIKIPIPLNSSKVQTASRRTRQLWTSRDSLYVQRTPSGRVHTDSLREADAVTIIGSGSKHARGGRCDRKALDHRIACKGCNQSIVGVRFQCATCPATKTQSYSLCANCEQRSYLLHDPMHIFFKLPRPVDRPIESQFAILPILPQVQQVDSTPLIPKVPYVTTLYHNVALCDHCMDRIKGVWFRCVYCAKDLCDVCENLNPHAHDRTHFFYVFKAPVDMQIFRIVAELDNLEGSLPVLKYPVYYS